MTASATTQEEFRIGFVEQTGRLSGRLVARGAEEFALLAGQLQECGLRLDSANGQPAVILDFVVRLWAPFVM